MTAYNVVRMRVKPGRNEDYLEAHRAIDRDTFAGALKKKLGLTVTSEKVEGGQRVYRLPAEG